MNKIKKLLFATVLTLIAVIATVVPTVLQAQTSYKGAPNKCDVSCTVMPGTSVYEDESFKEDDQPNPLLFEPAYIQFLTITFVTILLSAALMRHLAWRPPDLYIQNLSLQN